MREYLKTHKYKILKTYMPDEIKAYGDKEYFYDKEVTKRKIKLWRAKVFNKIGYQCVEDGCNLTDFHFALGEDRGGGIHLDLYGYDQEGDLVMVTLDHSKPKSKGGKNKVKNYQPLCKPHNEMKGNDYNWNRQFKDLNIIYPDKEIHSKNYMITKSVLTQEDHDTLINLGGKIFEMYGSELKVGKRYVQLVKKDEGVMMSDHETETMSNQDFINQAYGDVLIFGLGLGMIVFPLLMDDDISSITIVEQDEGVIDMVGKILKQHDYDNKVKIVHGDAFKYHKELKADDSFDTIYFDIWIKIEEESIAEMDRLHDLYRKYTRSNVSYINSWCYELKDEIE